MTEWILIALVAVSLLFLVVAVARWGLPSARLLDLLAELAQMIGGGGLAFSKRRDAETSPVTRVSVAHPRQMSKRFTSAVLVSLYNPIARGAVRSTIQGSFDNGARVEHRMNAVLPQCESITIRLTSQGVDFSPPVTCKLEKDHFSTTFTAMPKDNSAHGAHSVRIDIVNSESQHEYFSGTFQVFVADFVFDHVSQPVFSRATAVILGCASVASFVLAYLHQIDETVGLASGTTAAAVATAIYGRFVWLFRKLKCQGAVS